MSRPLMTLADRVDVFRGMAHPLRRKVLCRLGEGEVGVRELLTLLNVTPQTLSQHLSVLRETGLVEQRLIGRQRAYRLCRSTFKNAQKWITQVS